MEDDMTEKLTQDAIDAGYETVEDVVEDAEFIEALAGVDEDPVQFAEESGMLTHEA